MRILIAALLLLIQLPSFAGTISGHVKGQNGEPLPFANVYVKGTTTGTTTNSEGAYRLELTPGSYVIVYRFIGFKTFEQPITIENETLQIDVTLETEQYQLREVDINPNNEDPAYAIIRQAIAKRKYYLTEVKRYSCNVYIKGVQRMVKYPKKFLGQEIDFGDILDKKTGIFYLSESVSTYSFEQPNKSKEVMISSKVSGSNRAFSFNQASDMQFSPYENLMDVDGISSRGIVSPIASNALFYYDYRLEGSYFENGIWINKIAVLPKRKNDPVHRGFIYIQDGTWRVHSTDLYLTKQAQIEFVDTLRISMTYVVADKESDIWMPGSMTLRFVFRAFGFEGNGDYVAVYSKYDVKPVFPKKQFKGGAVVKVLEEANKKDTVYWEQIRPIPLTEVEELNYIKGDSLITLRESEPYLDSLDKKSNKIGWNSLLTGYSYTNRHQGTTYSVGSPISMIQFNTVEGWNVGLSFTFRKKLEEQKSIMATSSVRYGFSNERGSGFARVSYNFNKKRFGFLILEGGSDLVQFNGEEPISPLLNTGYTLFAEQNFMKLYKNAYGKIESRYELANGLRVSGALQYSQRSAVTNSTDYTLVEQPGRTYSSNNPLDPETDNLFFPDNNSLLFKANLRYRPGQKFIDRPDMKYVTGSKWPAITLAYDKGIKNLFDSDTDYDFAELSINDEMDAGLLGTFSYRVAAGDFLNDKSVYFMDAHHFNGNRTLFSSSEFNRFDILDYYTFSTSGPYTTVHLEHNFGGFVLNKLPLLRKLKLSEVAGFRYVYTEDYGEHYEFSIGVMKLNAFRFDVVTAWGDDLKPITKVVIGLAGMLD